MSRVSISWRHRLALRAVVGIVRMLVAAPTGPNRPTTGAMPAVHFSLFALSHAVYKDLGSHCVTILRIDTTALALRFLRKKIFDP
jgi:hypothetical protein